ncbi:hypothetical protein [Amycolatopsis sp. Hca4]|uniref:hypothetical protein n=1 Tax=Amycolatopsis sp. Hca4 TaxID=2742131 RepID=UPI0015903C48|nr:hypothetical protein [Amycolatopsis sp. Hca4]QKV75819.1 hypothetical protein HUT10_20100 [Amycolatopsis sp. Hca4]
MTDHGTQLPRAGAASPRRSRALLYTGIATAVLVVSAGVILIVNLPGGPPPVDYHVAVTGNVSASWVSDDGDGKLDLTTGGNSEMIRAGSLTITVQSTMPSGASCSIVGPNGNVVDDQITFPPRGTSGEDAATTVTCSTEKR